MKIPPKSVESFIRKIPKNIRAILLFGVDSGLISSLSSKITTHFLQDKVNNETVKNLEGAEIIKDQALLSTTLCSNDMFANTVSKVIVIHNCTAALTPIITNSFNNIGEDSLLLLLGADLPPNNSLRKLAETDPNFATIACYHDNKTSVKNYILSIIKANNFTIDPAALVWLTENLGNDRLITQQEINKLMCYKLDSKHIVLSDAINVVDNNADITLNDLVYAITLGNQLETYILLKQFLLTSPAIMLIRALNNNLRRLLNGKLMQQADSSLSAKDIASKLTPPIFYIHMDNFKSQLTRWGIKDIQLYLTKLTELEVLIKNNPALTEVLLNQFTFDIYLHLERNNIVL